MPSFLRATLAVMWALVAASAQALPTESPAPSEPCSVQTCNTKCQSDQTDCVLRCDGDIPCIQKCQAAADTCADTCTGT